MKKLLVFVLCCFIFVGCNCGRPKQDPNTITLWHWMVDRQDVFQELARRYEEQNPGIKIKIELFAPSDSYTRRIIAAAQARVLPDIYGILDKKQNFASFINNGFVADLTSEFKANNNEWENSLFPKAVDVNRFTVGNIYNVPAGIYGVPLDVTNIQMLYNKKLLKKAGIKEAPKTFSEFIDAAAALKKIGVSGFVSGWGEMWLADCFASNYAFNIMGEEKIMATFRGEVPYTDPDWVEVFNVFKLMSDRGILAEGIVTKPNKFAEQDFALERAGFTFNGSWCVNVYHDMNPDLEYGVMLPPVINGKLPMRIWGGAGSSFVVNNVSTKKQKAIAFLKWLTAEEQQTYLSRETKNLPANRKALESIPAILADFAAVMESTTHPTIWEQNEDLLVIEKFDKGIQSIIIGEKSPQQVAKEVQELKERQMKRIK